MVHFYRVQRQDELPRRAATFFLPQRLCFVQAVLPPKPCHWAGQAAWARPQGPTQGTGNEFRPLLPKLLPVTRDPHTDAIRSQATLGPRLPNSSGTSVSATDQRIPRLRSHTRRSVKPTAGPQTSGPLVPVSG